MVLAQLAGGLGASALGGLAQALGAGQREDAFSSALGQQADLLRRQQAASEAERARMIAELGGLSGQRQEAIGGLLQALGPGLAAARQEAMAGAGAELGGAPGALAGLIRQPSGFGATDAAANTARMAQQTEAGRAAPGQALQQLRLGTAMAQPFEAQARSAFGDEMRGIGRQAGELERDAAMRQALIDQQFGFESQAVQDALAQASAAGGLEQAIGGALMGLGPAIGAMVQPSQPESAPAINTAAGQDAIGLLLNDLMAPGNPVLPRPPGPPPPPGPRPGIPTSQGGLSALLSTPPTGQVAVASPF